jgi:hypothetical protein
MSIQVQYRRGTAAENNAFTGSLGEITVDTTTSTLRVHNGVTAGGTATVGLISVQTLSNKTLDEVTIVNGVLNGNANGVGNIGNATTGFNTVFAKSTSAQYADVAEKYLADRDYPPGTVVEIGGTAEVTDTKTFASAAIAGVVSTDPALIMNSGQAGAYSLAVALLGRVPCLVAGPVRRGDLLCSGTIPGHAVSMPADQYRPGAVIGKALQDHDAPGSGCIEILVGRL